MQVEIPRIKRLIVHELTLSVLYAGKTHLLVTAGLDIAVVEDIVDIGADSKQILASDVP